MNEELKKLYDAIASRGFYTKSYDEFVNQYQDPAYRDKVFDVVTREGLYTKGRNEFDAKYGAAPLKKKEPSVSTSQEGAMAPATEAGSLASPKSKTVETTRADGTPVTVQFGPTEFKSSDEAPVPQFKTFSEMAGQVDATIDEPTKQKISQAIGITGAVFNKIVNPNASVPEAINQAKAFADNTQAAYNVGVLSGQISNNMQQSVPDKERIAKLNRELKQEQTKLLSSQMGADASNFFDMLASNPVTFLTEVLTTSAAQMTTGVGGMRPEDLAAAGALTLATGTGGAAYMAGRNSLNAEMSSRIMGALDERGVDITDAAQLETAMTNRDLMMEIAGEVQAPATFVAALDALSAGMAGKLGKPIYEVLAQSAAGSIGEAGAQLIESGEITSASAVLTEAVAELPGGLVETAFGAKTKDVQRKIEINRQLKDVEAQIERTEDEDTKSVLRSVADNLRNEKNKIYDEYAAFVNSLPEEDVARLNSLNEEIVKTSKAIDQVDNAATKDALKARRSALLKQVEQLENKQPDSVKEQATDEAAVVPDEIQSLNDDEIVTFTVESLDQVPDEFRDRAEKKDGTEIEIRKTILGLPIGEKTTKVVNSGYTYTLTGKEAKDYAIQKQATDESVLRAEQPEVGLQEVGERDQEPQVAAEEVVVQEEVSPAVQEIEARRKREIEERELNRLFPLTVDDTAEGRRIQEQREQLDADLQELNARYDAEIAALGETTPVAQPAVENAVVQEEVVADVEEGAAAEVDAQELADLAADMQAATPARRERLERIAERARKAIARIVPDVKIIIHDTQQAYEAATSDTEQASYIGRTIHINAAKATPSAVAHEVFHAVFLDKVKTDAKAQAVAKKMVESLKRVLGENSEVYQYLDEFSKDYDANLQNEEKLAEMVAVLSELYSGVNDIGLSPSAVQSVKNAIKKFITDLAKLFNIPMPTTLTDADVLAVLNTIAQKTVTGEVITEADVQAIDRMVSEDIGSAESLLVNQGLEVPPVVNIKPRQRISAQTNEEARASLQKKARMIFPSSTDDALTIDEMRVYHMNDDFSWIKDGLYFESYENVANLLAEIISKPDVHMFPSPTMRGGFMVVDESAAVPQVEMNIHLSPRKDNVVYIEGIELFDAKLSNSGAGTRLMNRLTSAADKLGLTLKLDAYPTRKFQYDREKKRDISDKQLDKMADRLVTDFYSKFGFYSPKNNTNRAARSMERKPMTEVDVNQIRQRKGLITITEREAMKYARIGINDARVAQAMEDIGLAGVRFTKGDVNVAIENAFNTAMQDIRQTDMYNGQPAVITQDSPAITRAIEAEIVALEEQGASISRIESAKRMIEDKETRFRYIKNYQDAQTETLSQWTSYLSQSPYDPAFKMLMLDAVVTNNYDLSIDKYIKRDNKTIRNITPFDAGALAQLYGMTDSKELLKTYTEIQSDNAENVVKSNEVKSTKDGKWLKFNGGENTPQSEREVNAVALSQLVQDTYWCTKSNASSQLDGGDFYVYATKDKSGKYRSRIAVRMDGDDVGEVRGNASAKQDVEADMLPVAEKFLREEIPNDSGKKWLDSIEYNKKAKAFAESISDKKLSMDMIKEFGILSGDASKYSVDYGNNGFVERIENIITLKALEGDVTADLKGKVATRKSDLKPTTTVFIGDISSLSLYNDNAVGLEVVVGRVDLRPVLTLRDNGVNLPDASRAFPPKLKSIYGDLNISTPVDFSALENVYGSLFVGEEVKSLGNIKVVSGKINIAQASDLKDLGKIEVINSQYDFAIPDGVQELKYLKTINGGLRKASGLKSLGSLENINGNLSLQYDDSKLESLGNLKSITGDAYLPKTLLKIDGVNIGGDVYMSVNTEIVNIKKFNGDLRIDRSDDEINKLPKIDSLEEVTGTLSMPGNIKTLGNLRRVGGRLFIGSNNLETFGNLEYVGEDLSSLSDSLKSFGNLKYVGGDLKVFSNAIEDLGSLEYVGGNFSSLSFGNAPVSSLGKLKYVGGDLSVRAFTQLEDLGSLEYVGGLFSISAPLLKDLGSLNSLGKGYFEKTYGDPTKRNILSEVNESRLPALASRYISESDIYPGDVNDIIKDNIFNLALKQAAEHFSIELPPAPRQRKDSGIAYENWKNGPKSGAQEIGYKYNMNFNGYTPSNIVKQHFKNDVERLSKRLSIRSTITGSGYYMTLDGKFFNPYLKVIGGQDGGANGLRQRMGQPNENIFDIVTMARQKGYTDKTIEIYLKQEGFAAEDIKDAMAVNSNIDGAQVPQEFGNVTGGMAQGQTLFDEIKAKLTKMAADGASMMGIRIEAQTLLMDSEVYKAQSVEVKAQLRLSLDSTIGTKAADRAFRQEFKELRAMLSDRKKARRELEAIKRTMRGFIRKNLPQGEYSKAEVVALLKAIVDANVDTLPLVMEKVEGYVTGFKVRNLDKQIQKLLDTKTTRVDSGRLMGATTVELQEDLAALNEELANADMSEQQIADMLRRQLIDYDGLESSYEMTEDQARRMQILDIAMMYNEAMLLEDNDPNKVESLTSARNQLVAMITTGRAEFKAIKAAQHQEYNQRLRDMVEAITGESVPDDIDTKDGLDDFVRKSEVTRQNQEAVRGRIVKAWNAFFGKPVTDYFDKNGSLHTLLSRVTANLTDQFGGPVHEMVYDRLKQASIEFERRMQMLNKMIDAKGQEIFGKDYDNVVKNNRIKKPVDVFADKAKANRLMNEVKTASSQRKSEINLELNKLRVFGPMSQNQIYYLYNQFKDVANRSGFEATFGKDYVQNLNELFDTSLDPNVKEWADWQVLEFYPSVYDAYNDVYKKIFRTNMPWNPNYAGRLYRDNDADDAMAITFMDGEGQFSNIQTPSSTKMRRANRNRIQIVDGDAALTSYLGDMEYFRAYGETIRDVDKLFKNRAVQESIKKVAGDDVLKMIEHQIKLIGTRGTSLGTAAKETMLDNISSRFSRAVLMANPSQFIKQATSLFAFANRIGFENWAAYTAKAAPQMGKLWNEFMDNAPRIRKRYNPRELTAIIGTYKPGRTAGLMPKDKNGNPILRQAGEVYDKVIDAMMWPVIRGDKFSAMAGAMGNYLYYKEMFLQKNPSATNEQAIKFAADKVSTEIEQTLGSSDVIDKDFYQNNGSALYRAFSVLQNSPKAMIRQILPAYSGLFKKISKMDKRAGAGTLKQNLETIFMFQFFVPMLFQYAVLGFPGLMREWRDDDEEEMGMTALLGPFSALFFIGDLLTMGKDLILGKPWATDARTAPGWDLLADAGKAAKKLANADSDEEVNEALSEIAYSLSAAAGLGLKNISRLANNIVEVIDDGIDSGESVLRLLNYSDYTIEGPE